MTEYMKRLRQFVGHDHIMQCGASVIVVNDKSELLLQLRIDNGCWGYAGGAVELGESTESAAKRELFEETGLIADKLELYGVFSGEKQHYIYPNGDEVSNIDTVYTCHEYHGELKCQENEVSELRFFKFDSLPDNLSPPVADILQKFVSERLPCMEKPRPISAFDRESISEYIKTQWGSTNMILRGIIVDLTKADGFIMTENDNIIGLITYITINDVCEITSFNSELPNKGIGTKLLDAVINKAKSLNCIKLQLITSNDNINAIKFYQKRGFDLIKINHGAIDEARKIKPEIPLIGQNGIPIHHEIEFTMKLK